MRLPVDPDENLVQVPSPLGIASLIKAPFFDLRCEHRTKPVPPGANRFMADIDAAFVEQIFDLPQ
jgi:hypothetical protein